MFKLFIVLLAVLASVVATPVHVPGKTYRKVLIAPHPLTVVSNNYSSNCFKN
jgi:hypothetical protein